MNDVPALRRDPHAAQIAGVCVALAREWRIDPLLVRLGFVAAALITNGVAIGAYLVGWALIPRTGGAGEPIRHLLPFTRGWSRGTLVLAVVTATLGGLVVTGAGPGALAIMGIVWLVLRLGRGRQSAPAPAPSDPATPRTEFERLALAWQSRLDNVDAGRPAGWEPPLSAATAPAPDGTRAPAGTRRRRGWRTWCGVVVVLGGAWSALGVLVARGTDVPGLAWVASTLAVLSLALIVVASPGRAVHGRPGGLVPATVVAAAATVTMLLIPAPSALVAPEMHRAVGPVAVPSETELPSGDQTINLRDAVVVQTETVTYRQDMGRLTVLLPASGNVRVEASVDVGSLVAPDASAHGVEQTLTWERIDDPSAPVLTVRAALDVGRVEVQP
ncbi:PspC domain-containing protein [Propioniciclava soli]|uniref:PspC domain-containing protein n=1 Tax=Propioniciclava soli TaxID=2775081 RepID=A0ABZ3CD39_9ACTN